MLEPGMGIWFFNFCAWRGGGGSFITIVFWMNSVAATDPSYTEARMKMHYSSLTTPSIASFCETEGVYIDTGGWFISLAIREAVQTVTHSTIGLSRRSLCQILISGVPGLTHISSLENVSQKPSPSRYNSN